MRLDLIFALSMGETLEEAHRTGRQLIEEAHGRKQDNELLIALTRLTLVRAQGENHAAVEQLLLEAKPVIVARLAFTRCLLQPQVLQSREPPFRRILRADDAIGCIGRGQVDCLDRNLLFGAQ